MLNNLETIFDNMVEMMKKLKKKSYEANMKRFLEKNQHYFVEMTEYMDAAEDKDAAAKEIATVFADTVDDAFGKGEEVWEKIDGSSLKLERYN